ncbi:MAG: RES family NAD+ phosphorylase [Burkholderiaceae bacterium]
MKSASGEVLWRIAKHTTLYKATDLTGGGAKATGGRWNSKGVPVVYTSTSIALATVETMAHLGGDLAIRNAFLAKITVPAAVWDQREYITAQDFEPTWLAEPPGSTSIDYGDEWLFSGAAPLLMVPSVIIPEEFNVLINPGHPESKKITAIVLRQYIYDPRYG